MWLYVCISVVLRLYPLSAMVTLLSDHNWRNDPKFQSPAFPSNVYILRAYCGSSTTPPITSPYHVGSADTSVVGPPVDIIAMAGWGMALIETC